MRWELLNSRRIGLPARPRQVNRTYRIRRWMFSVVMSVALTVFAAIYSIDLDVATPISKLTAEFRYAFEPLTFRPDDAQLAAPRLAGRTISEARSEVAAQGLTLIVEPVVDPQTPVGQVVSQVPVAGSLLPEGASILVQIAVADDQIALGSFIGENIDQAQAQLLSDGFVVETVKIFQPNLPVGVVAEQFPNPGTRVATGARLILTYNAGLRLLTVPDLVGLEVPVAVRRAAAAGFTATSASAIGYNRALAPGTVSGQQPQPGSILALGEEMTLFVNESPVVEVPNLVGLELETARSVAQRAGIEIETVINPAPQTGLAFLVRAQSLLAGERVAFGSKILLVVGYGPAG